MAITVGTSAPQFTLVDTARTLRSLGEFSGKKVVLVFYPGAFTGVCEKELCTFRDSLAQFNTVDAQVVGISVDSPFANQAFANKNRVTFPILSDVNREVSKAYGGVHENFAGIPGYEAAKRAVYVVDGGGMVSYAWVSENPGVEPPYDEVQKAVA